jgi:hypothetical protein
LRCVRLRSGYDRPPPRTAQGAFLDRRAILERGSRLDAD